MRITAIIRYQYQAKLKTRFLKPGHTVTRNSVKKNTHSFKSEKSYHLTFFINLFNILPKHIAAPPAPPYGCNSI
jgi:hypothetical protein